jgi:NADH:ubiquinone oxidoreductase subunit F (NADH-binding)
VLDAVDAAARAGGATIAYLCVEAGDMPATLDAEMEPAPVGEVDVRVVPVTPRLVLEDDTALLRLLEGRQAIPYVRVPPSAPLTLRGLPAVVRNLEMLLPDAADAPAGEHAPWPAGMLEAVPSGTCGVAFTGDVIRVLSAESCGACVACREGTRQIADILADLVKSEAGAGAMELLQELAAAMEAGSICHVGIAGAALLRGSLDVFAADYRAHVAGGSCSEGQAHA